jgi:hypothetical protein
MWKSLKMGAGFTASQSNYTLLTSPMCSTLFT